jgi:Phosphotransferase enzyme family
MPRLSSIGIMRTGTLEEHPAIKSWRVLQPGRVELQGIEILEENKKSGAYRIAGVGLGGSAVIAKQCRYKSALIERTIYEAVLPHLPLPRLHYYGFVQSDDDWCWLFVEDAGGEEYSPWIEEHRLLIARWLGTMHMSAARVAAASRLPDRGPNYYLACLQSAYVVIQRALADPTLNRNDRLILESIVSQCDLLKGHWSRIEQTCESVPRTVVHGDFVRKNLRVRTGPSGIVLLPFDWETAGWGLPITDLAAADLARLADDSAAASESPEISVYRSIVSEFWPQFGGHDRRVLANLGIMFRLIDAVKWACAGLAEERSDGAMARSLGQLRSYQDGMAGAIQAVIWGS